MRDVWWVEVLISRGVSAYFSYLVASSTPSPGGTRDPASTYVPSTIHRLSRHKATYEWNLP